MARNETTPPGVGTQTPSHRSVDVTTQPSATTEVGAPASSAPGADTSDAAAPAASVPPGERGRRRSAGGLLGGGRKRLLLGALAVAAVGFVAWKGGHWLIEGRHWVSTDDAYVKAETVTIAPRVAGHVVRVAVADLQRVAAGDLLAVIDPGDGALALRAAETRLATQAATLARIDAQAGAGRAAVVQAEASREAAEADVARTRADFERAQTLVKTSAGTQQALDAARAARDRTEANVAVAAAGVESARAALAVVEGQRAEAVAVRDELAVALDKAKRDLAFTEIRAPFAGTVGNKAVVPGMYVQPGTRLMALVPLDEVFVEANFKETQTGKIRPGARARITVDGLPGREIEGRVVGLSPATGAQFSLLPPENATGNFTKIVQRLPVRIAVPAEVAREGVLRAGLSVEADIDTRPAE